MAGTGPEIKGERQKASRPAKKGVSYFTFGASLLITLVVGLIVGFRGEQWAGVFGARPAGLDTRSLNRTYNDLKQNYDGTLDTQKLLEGANRGLTEAAGDPYTVYFDKNEAKQFDNDLEGTFSGIGAELDKKDDKLIIVSPLENSPAQKAGLQAGDVIVKVNDQQTTNWSIDKAVSQIKGKKGTTVKLAVVRGDGVKDFSITRDIITEASVKTDKKGTVGIIRISRFGSDTAGLTRKAAQKFKDENVSGIVLDLRGNGGGYLEIAQDVSSLWLERDQVVVTERRGSMITQTHKATGDSILHGIPTVVLVDQGSASASEIVAGALQDHHAAKLVGQKTFGKGSVQKVVDLSGGAKLKVTIAKWYTPKGKNISKEGITPDEALAVGKNDTKNNDSQLNKGLEIVSQ